jgi:hypothetical protein
MLHVRCFVPVALFLMFGCSSSSEWPDTTPTWSTLQSPIMDGYNAVDDHAVVGLVALSGGGGIGICSGTLIAPNVVLTAQHCVAPLNNSNGTVDCNTTTFGDAYGPGVLYVSTRTQLTQNPADYHGTSGVMIPPGSNTVCGRDIALLILSKPISPDEAVPMTPRVDSNVLDSTDSPASHGDPYSAIGYGNVSQWSGGSGVRRRRDNLYVSCSGPKCAVYGLSNEWLGETGVCQGDSGGPAVDGLERVTGVASRGAAGCAHPVYSSVYDWRDWIIETVIAASKDNGLEPPFWTTGWSTHPGAQFSMGEPCTNGLGCESGLCLDGFCSRYCDDNAYCPLGFACLPIESGTATYDGDYCQLLPVGAPCESTDECIEPGLCIAGMCTRDCYVDIGCPDPYWCDPELDMCMLPAVGAACVEGETCPSGLCQDGLCTRQCDDTMACPEPYTCTDEGLCDLPPVGDECGTDADCESGVCGESICTHACGEHAPCPDGFVCDPSGELCAPSPVGDVCESSSDCLGLPCVDGQCRAICDADQPCPKGNECTGAGVCMRVETPSSDSGCQFTSASAPSATPFLILLVFLAFARAWGRRTTIPSP